MSTPDDGSPATYATIAARATAEFTVRGSTFLGHARPVATVDAAEQFVEAVGEEYADATHNVPAYRVHADASGTLLREYSSDDGEPSGSAGKPALNVLQQRDLENVAVVVTRYYGGTKLGVGGLVRAYSRAVSAAVDAAGVVTERPHETLTIDVAYDDSGTVRGILDSGEYEFDATYEATVTFAVRVPLEERAELADHLRSATSGRATLSVDDTQADSSTTE